MGIELDYIVMAKPVKLFKVWRVLYTPLEYMGDNAISIAPIYNYFTRKKSGFLLTEEGYNKK